MKAVKARTSQLVILKLHRVISGELAFRSYFQHRSAKLNMCSEVILNIFFFLYYSLVKIPSLNPRGSGENDMNGNEQDNTIGTVHVHRLGSHFDNKTPFSTHGSLIACMSKLSRCVPK